MTKKFHIDKDISLASTLNSDFYTNQQIYNQSIKNIFEKSWQLVYHKTMLNNNNIFPFDFLRTSVNEPLVISINKSEIKCFSNVCTHRGSIINKKICQSSKMVCGYHGRTFDLNGKIKAAPGFKGVKNFPEKKDNLQNFPIINWNDFIFTSVNPKININPIFDDISIRLKKNYTNIKFNPSLSKTYELDAHWALYCENYLEGFHVSFVHKGLAKQIDINKYQTEILENGVLQYAISKDKEPYAYYYWIFPNIMLNFYDWGISINIVEPISINKTRIKFLTFTSSNKNIKKLIEELNQVELEDEEVVLNVQKGINSKSYNKGRYSVKYEKGVHYFHQLLSQYIDS